MEICVKLQILLYSLKVLWVHALTYACLITKSMCNLSLHIYNVTNILIYTVEADV